MALALSLMKLRGTARELLASMLLGLNGVLCFFEKRELYKTEFLSNNIQLGVINAPREREISVRVSAEWDFVEFGNIHTGSCGLNNFMMSRHQSKQKEGAWSDGKFIHRTLYTNRHTFKEDLNAFLSQFRVKETGAEINMDALMEKMFRNGEISDDEFNVIVNELLVKSRILAQVSRNAGEENIGYLREALESLRSGGERVASEEEFNRKKHILMSIPGGIPKKVLNLPGYRFICFMENNRHEAAVGKRALDAIKHILERRVMRELLWTEKLEDYRGLKFELHSGLKKYGFITAGFLLNIKDVKGKFSIEDHEKILRSLFLYLKNVEISEKEIQSYISEMTAEYEDKMKKQPVLVPMNVLAESFYIWPPEEKCLGFGDYFGNLTQESIKSMLEKLASSGVWQSVQFVDKRYGSMTSIQELDDGYEMIQRVTSG